jgi:hypothetical protein
MHIVADKADHTVYASYKGWGENMDDRHALRWTGGAGAWNYMWLYGWTGQPSILMPDDDGSFTHIYTFMGILEVIGFPSWGSAWSGMVGMDSTNVRMASTNFHERDDTFNLVSYHRDNGADINSAQFVRILKTNIGSYTVRTILQGASGDTVDAPGLCMDKTGKLHVAFRVVSGSTSMVKYADSTDTGNNWSTPLTIVSGADTILDEHVGIDTDSNNRIYVTYTQGPFIYMSYSDDGVAWNEPMAMYKGALPIGYHYTQPFPLVTSDNSLHIFYILKDSIFDYGNLFETTWK